MPFKDYVPEGEIPEVSKGQVYMDYVPEPKPELKEEEAIDRKLAEIDAKAESKARKARKEKTDETN